MHPPFFAVFSAYACPWAQSKTNTPSRQSSQAHRPDKDWNYVSKQPGKVGHNRTCSTLSVDIVKSFIAIVTIACSVSVQAATFQVGSSRSYETLQALFQSVDLGPSDIVEIDPGSYPGDVVVPPSASGTEQQPVIIRGVESGNKPHFSGGDNTIYNRASHIVFEDLEISGTGSAGSGTRRCFFFQGDNVTLRRLYIHDCPGHGLLGADQGSGSLTMEHSEVSNIGTDGRYHAIYMATDQVAYPGAVFRLQHSYIHDSQFDDNRIGGNLIKSRAERNEIYYNWLEGAYYHELELIGPDPGGAPSGWSEGLAREDSDIVGNVILHTEPFGSIMRFGGDATGQSFGRYRFVNNTVVRTGNGSATVFRLFDGIESLEAHNNVLWMDNDDTLRVIREVEAIWLGGTTKITGSFNWIQSQNSFMPEGFSNTITGLHPEFSMQGLFDFRPDPASDTVDGGTQTTTTAGYEIDSPLVLPDSHPPLRSVAADSAPRASDNDIDIGAYEFADRIFTGSNELTR